MLLVRTSIRPSSIHGVGCFAEEKIKKGQVIWILDERIDQIIQLSDVSKFPDSVQDFLQIYGYTAMFEGEKVLILCGDNARHYNHSDHPNSLDTKFTTSAGQDIEVGEELTCDYRSFDLDWDGKW